MENSHLENSASESEKAAEINLRPVSFKEYLGQDACKANLEIYCAAAKKRKESMDHLLLCGPPGLGKTTLAKIIAKELKVNIISTTGPAIEKKGDLAGLLTNLEEHDVLFIDEIHRLHISLEETLYSAMEDSCIDIIMGEGPHARSIKFGLPHFTLVGATTRSGLLSAPLRDRFGIIERLEYYEPEILQKIILNAANKLGFVIEEDAAMEMGKRSRGTPRIAIRLARRLRDYLTLSDKKSADLEMANLTLKNIGVDEAGLDRFCRSYLKSLISKFNGGPVGLNTLAASLGEEERTIETLYESYLIQSGFIERRPQGRFATPLAYQHLGEAMNHPPKSNKLFS